MTKELIEAGALRQFKHNDGSEGFVCAYDREIVDRVFASRRVTNVLTWQQRCDWVSAEPAVWLMHQAMKAEIADLRAALARAPLPAHPVQDGEKDAVIRAIIDHIADNWPMKKYSLEEIEDRLRADLAAMAAAQKDAKGGTQ